MSSQVTALLVVHDEPDLALRAFTAIKNQSTKVDRIVVVDSSSNPIEFPVETLKVSRKSKLGAIVNAGLTGLAPASDHWLWLVHDDSEPKVNALEELLAAVGSSDNIALVGPMQLSSKNPREITQVGVTISRFGEIINPISGQLDQGQHDSVEDVFAIGTSGLLVRTDVYEVVGGFDHRAPALAADVDFSIRVHRHGYRVVTAPRAKVSHAALTLSGDRGKAWLKGGKKTALRRATINLRLVHDPLFFAILYWLALPLVTVYRIFWRLAQKRPSYLLPELRAGFWGFFTIFSRLASRGNTGKLATKTLAPLRASWTQLSTHNRRAVENEESAQSLASFERGDHETVSEITAKNFTRGGGWIFSVLLLALSWNQLPVGQALTGGSALPLSGDWLTLFARAGASWQPIGQGFFGPSDPFNWVLLFLGSFTFWAPNLSIVILLWLARTLAFASSWRLLSLLTAKAWQRNLGALVYALLPAFTAAISVGELPAVLVTMLSPWLVFAVARAAGLGRSGSARSDSRTWSWIGLAGVLLAAVGAAAPAFVLLAMVGLALVAFTKIRRLGYLFWIPLPLAAIYLPLVVYEIVGLGHPLALLAEPTLGVTKTNSATSALVQLSSWTNWALALLLVLAVLSLLIRRWVVSLALTSFVILTFVLLQFMQSLSFPADTISANAGLQRVSSSGHSIASAVGLGLIALAVHFAANLSTKPLLAVVGISLVLVSAPLAWLSLTEPSKTRVNDGSVVPLLLQKEAEQGTDLQLLVVNQAKDTYQVQWLPIAGVHLEDSNLAYRFSGSSTAKTQQYRQLAQVVGDLASANGNADSKLLETNRVGYILVPTKQINASLVASLESSPLLESAGLTPFGDLWRVKGISASDLPAAKHSPWSITKLVQLATLLGFILLAIPSRPRAKRATDSVIFIDQSESELDV